jgi:hypothetical protein
VTVKTSVSVACPSCGGTHEVVVHQSINVGLDPELKAQLIAGAVNTFECPGSSTTIRLGIDLLYHDPAARLFIYLALDGESRRAEIARDLEEVPASAGLSYRLRLVVDYPALLEKIRLFDDQLDDRIIEVLKLHIGAQCPPELRDGALSYDSRSRDAAGQPVLVFRNSLAPGKRMECPLGLYDWWQRSGILDLEGAADSGLLLVDQAYGGQLVEKLQNRLA